MRKISVTVALALALGLAGCNAPTLNLASQVNLNTVEGIVSAYGIVVSTEVQLRQLPQCKIGVNPSASNICIKRSVLVSLQSADRVANTAVNQAVAFVKNNPSVSPAQYITAAQSALLSAQTIINSAKGN
jgi:hypothetical protein